MVLNWAFYIFAPGAFKCFFLILRHHEEKYSNDKKTLPIFFKNFTQLVSSQSYTQNTL